VLQHFSKANAYTAPDEIRRILSEEGNALVQMPNVYGIRCPYHQVRRSFREARDFEVRYWRPAELLAAFTNRFGRSELSVDVVFSLNVQPTDLHLLPWRYRMLVRTSERFRRVSSALPLLLKVADSLYISANRSTSA